MSHSVSRGSCCSTVNPGPRVLLQVVNGASDLLVEIFGKEVGQHSRFAVGCNSLPRNVPVEVPRDSIADRVLPGSWTKCGVSF